MLMRLILFLTVFCSVYGGLHAYVFFKIRAALGMRPAATVLVLVFFAIMTLAPILIRIVEKTGNLPLATCAAYAGYTWMGIIFLMFCFYLVFDVLYLLTYGAGLLFHSKIAISAGVKTLVLSVISALTLYIVIFGLWEATAIGVERITIKTNKLPETLPRITIAQISDVHLGVLVGQKMVGKIVKIIKREAPDIVISTGDLVDQDLTGSTELACLLDSIPSRYGKFAVTGNHEVFAGLAQALEFTRQSGFTVLRSDTVTIAGCLTLAGVDDPGHHMAGITPKVSEHDLLASAPHKHFVVFLKHAPLVPKGPMGLFDLMLSGHTHKGQLFPFTLFIHTTFKYYAGLYQLADHTNIYVSRGTGTWGPPMRFLAPPEVTMITIERE
jgi:uncharacterized protein